MHILRVLSSGKKPKESMKFQKIEEQQPKLLHENHEISNGSTLYQKEDLKETSSFKGLDGLLYALVSASYSSMVSCIVREVVELHPIQLVLIQSFSILIPSSITLFYNRTSPLPNRHHLYLILTSVFAILSVTSIFLAFRHLLLGNVSGVLIGFPILVTVVARIVLKETFTVFHMVAVLLITVGVLLGIQSQMSLYHLAYNTWDSVLGISAAFVALVLNVVVFILTRKIADLHFMVILFNYGATGTVLGVSACVFVGSLQWMIAPRHQLLILLFSIFSFLGKFYIVKALQWEEAGPVSTACSTEIVFMYIWQCLFFSIEPTIISIVGGTLVIVSIILIGVRIVFEKHNLAQSGLEDVDFLTIT